MYKQYKTVTEKTEGYYDKIDDGQPLKYPNGNSDGDNYCEPKIYKQGS